MNTLLGVNYIETLIAGAFTPPNSCITNAAVLAGAGIDASKLDHHHAKHGSLAGSAVDGNHAIHAVCGATATAIAFKAWCITPATGSSTCTVDLKKNGTSVLSAVITLDSSSVARTVEEGVITTASAVAGDVYEVVLTATQAGTDALPTDIGWEFRIDETYS